MKPENILKLVVIINRHVGAIPERINEYECVSFTDKQNAKAAVREAFLKELVSLAEKNNNDHISISYEKIAPLVEELLDRENGILSHNGEGAIGTSGNSPDVFIHYNEVNCNMTLCHECEEVGTLFEVVAVPLPGEPLEAPGNAL